MTSRLYHYITFHSSAKSKNMATKGFLFMEGDTVYFLELTFWGNLKEHCTTNQFLQ